MFCHNCGAVLKEDARFCPRCGNGVYDPVSRTAAEPVAPKENVAMGTLGACIGGLLGIGLFLLCSRNGIYPAFVGIFLSASVVVGYDWLGKVRGVTGTVIVTVLLVALPWVAWGLNMALLILDSYEGMGLTLLDGVGLLILFLLQGNLPIGYLAQELLTLYGFAILGAVIAFVWSYRRSNRIPVG